jgi:shikimate kinase
MLTVGGFTVKFAVLDTPKVAVMIAEVEVVTPVVVTWKVPVVEPAATVAVAGTITEALLLESVIVAADAAAPLNVMVPVEEVPPVTAVGFKLSEASAGLIETVRLAVAVWAGVAESVTVTVKLKVPDAVGVPDNTPAELSVIPVGSAPDVTAQV